MTKEKEPINNDLLEKRILDQMLSSSDVTDYVLNRIEPDFFYTGKYAKMVQFLQEMRKKGLDISHSTVYDFLHNKSGGKTAQEIADITFESYQAGDMHGDYSINTLDTDLANLNESKVLRDLETAQRSGASSEKLAEILSCGEMFKRRGAEILTREQILSESEQPEPVKYSTGIKRLDGNFKFIKGQLTVVTGIPSHGKSEFMDQVLMNTMQDYSFKWLVYSGENHPVGLNHLNSKLVPKFLKTVDADPEDILKAKNQILDFVSFINPNSKLRTLQDILNLVSEEFDAVLVDPWNNIDHNFEKYGMTETRYIEQSLTEVATVARRCNCHIFIVVHPKKQENLKNVNYPKAPTAYDIHGSAHWGNKADNILTIYKPMFETETACFPSPNSEVHVYKIRNRALGSVGKVPLKYNTETGEIN